MEWWKIISLAITYGPQVYEYAKKYGPLAAELAAAVTPVITKAIETGVVGGDTAVAKVNDVLAGIGQPHLTSAQAASVERMWMDRASGAPGDGFAGFG